MKTCVRCGQDVPRSNFYAHAATLDGLQSWCKPCYKAWRRERYLLRREVELAKNREWELAHPEARKAIARRTYAKCREKRLVTMRQWREKNPAKHKSNYRRWAQANPEAVRALVQKRRARELNAPGFATAEQITARWNLFGGRCWMCGDPATSIDHVIALSRGGSNWPANLRPACIPCNSRAGNRKRADLACFVR